MVPKEHSRHGYTRKIQIRAVNHILGLQGRSYREKIKELGLESLERIREQCDLMHTFKILNGIDVVDSEIWLRQMGNEVLQETHPTTKPCSSEI